MTQDNRWDKEQVTAIIAGLKDQPGALLPVLHGIQDALGYIPEDAVPLIAKEMNMTRADVHGVITFYHHFRQTPPGQHTIHICRAEACQAMHCDATIAHAKDKLGVDFHETDATGQYTLEPIYCLGNCSLSPAIMIDEQVHGRVTPEKFDALLKKLEGEVA